MLLRRKPSSIEEHGEHAMRSRRGPAAHGVARHTRDELRRAERRAPHEYTTAQLRTTTPGRALPQLDRVRRCY